MVIGKKRIKIPLIYLVLDLLVFFCLFVFDLSSDLAFS